MKNKFSLASLFSMFGSEKTPTLPVSLVMLADEYSRALLPYTELPADSRGLEYRLDRNTILPDESMPYTPPTIVLSLHCDRADGVADYILSLGLGDEEAANRMQGRGDHLDLVLAQDGAEEEASCDVAMAAGDYYYQYFNQTRADVFHHIRDFIVQTSPESALRYAMIAARSRNPGFGPDLN